jgi:hypothetical protein
VKAIACLLLLAACEAPPAPVDRCTARIDVLAERLDKAQRYADPSGAPPDVALPHGRRGIPLVGAPPILVVTRDDVRLAGRGIGGGDDVDRLAETLAQDLRTMADITAEGDRPWLVALWAEPELGVERLVRILARAPPRARFALLIRGDDVRLPPAPSWTRDLRRDVGDPLDRGERLDAAWLRATRSCEAAREDLPLPAELAPASSSVRSLIAALRRCGCDHTDLNAIQSVALAALVPPDGPLVRVAPTLRFGPAFEGGRELVLGPNTDVASMVRRIPRVRQTVWVSVE